MNKITVIIPTFNLQSLPGRGWQRVRMSVLSLQNQPCRIIVSDGSYSSGHDLLTKALDGLQCEIIHTPMLEFNKPDLLNTAIEECGESWFLCTDADYLFHPHFIEEAARYMSPGTVVLNKVRMMSERHAVTEDMVRWWTPPLCHPERFPFNPYGDLANGGCQLFHRSWFDRSGGYDERMSGWCGMDNDMVNRARMAGLDVVWMENPNLLHQWHPVNKGKTMDQRRKMERNWKLRDNMKNVNWRDSL